MSEFSDSEDEQAISSQEEEVSQPLAGDNLQQPQQILDHINAFYGPCKEKGKLKCLRPSCGQVISYTVGKSNFNLKNHYTNKHPKRKADLVAALSGGSKRGKRASVATASATAR